MRFWVRWAVGAALSFVVTGCSNAPDASPEKKDCGAPRRDAQTPYADAGRGAGGNSVDSGLAADASTDASRDAGADAMNGDAGNTPVDAAIALRPSPVPLSKLIGTGSESRAELVSKLRDDTLSTTEPFHPYGYDGTDWAKSAADLVANGWQANQEPALAMVPPIDWGDGHDDPNWHFQLNSLRPSIPFAYAAWQTGDAANLGRMLAVVNDWIDANLLDDCTNDKKWYDMSAGLRAHYLGVTLVELLRRGPEASDARAEESFERMVEKLVWTLHEHGTKLAEPSFLPAGNHALFVMLGLATVCRAVPHFGECVDWPSYAVGGVRNYVDGSVSSENVTLEHSPQYQRFVALTLRDLDVTALFDEDLKRVADGMLENFVWMYHPDAEIALVGDSEGHAVQGESAQLDYVLSEGNSGTAPVAAPVGFYEAGFAVLRDDWARRPMSGHSYLFFSAAHHSSVHKQADDLTFEWSHQGIPIIIDSGKFEYKASPERTFFVSTRAANTIEVDGMSHAVGGDAAFGSALTEVGKTASGVQYASATAPRKPSDVEHARVLAMHDDWLLVADRLTSATEHTYRQWFGLHENFDLDESGSAPIADDGRGNTVRLLPLADHEAFESARGQDDPMQGWVSHVYQTRVPRWSIASRVTAANATMVVLFATPAVTEASAVSVGDSLRIKIDSGGTERSYTITFGQASGSFTE